MQLNVRYLHQQQIQALKSQGSHCKKIILNKNSKQELRWWIQNSKICNGCYLMQSHSQMLIQADSSRKGWGAVCQGISTGGQWSKKEQLLHIYVLEWKKQKLGKQFNRHHHCAIYLVKIGGTGNQMLLQLNKEIWQYLSKHQTKITAEYFPRCLNLEAD